MQGWTPPVQSQIDDADADALGKNMISVGHTANNASIDLNISNINTPDIEIPIKSGS